MRDRHYVRIAAVILMLVSMFTAYNTRYEFTTEGRLVSDSPAIENKIVEEVREYSENTPLIPVESETTSKTIHKHKYHIAKTVDATCEKAGYTIYKCSCGKAYQKDVPCLGHWWKESERIKATHVLDGKVDYICTRCKKTKTKTLEHLRDAGDTDMCGESLIEKPLPHSKDYNLAAKVFELYHKHYPITVPNNENCVTISKYDAKHSSDILEEYQYFSCGPYVIYTKLDDNADSGKLVIYYDKNRAQEAKRSYDKAKEILSQLGINKNTTQKEAIIRINEYLCDFKQYDDAALNNKKLADGSMEHSIFDSLGICHNYAVAFQVLCLSAGIECHYFVSEPMNHAWNIVYFSDGSKFHVDTCWNDRRILVDDVEYEVNNKNTTKDYREELRTKYLLITSDEMKVDHPF